jgi:nucleotide-binding universal stress UspA family protein
MMGSVTAKVLQKVNLPVWLHPEKATPTSFTGISHIFCAIDFDYEALPVLLYSKQMADASGAAVTLIHSVPEEEARPNKYFDSELFSVLVGIAREEIAALQARAGTNFAVRVTGLPISHALAEPETEDKANLILIGRGHAQKFLGRFRTHAYQLLNEVTCPVLSFCQTRADVAAGNSLPTLEARV